MEVNVLTTHSIRFIKGYIVGNTIKDHSDIETGNPQPPILFSISGKDSFICTIHSHDSIYHGLC